MRFTIKSRKLKKDVEFSIPGKSYIYVDLSGNGSAPGTLGKQICSGGGLTGSTMSYGGDNQKTFEKMCRNWFRQYLRDEFDYLD